MTATPNGDATGYAKENAYIEESPQSSTPSDSEATEKQQEPHPAADGSPSCTLDEDDPLTRNPHLQTGWRLAGTLFCLGICLMLSLMDTSIVATALLTISIDFNDFARSNWVVLAYTLTYMGFAITFARLSDVIGRRPAVLVALGIFTVFSLACGLARSLVQLIVFRALAGVGGSGLYAMPMVVFPEVTSAEQMPVVAGVYGAVIALAGILGPLLGGAITRYSSWRWIFLLNVPCCALVFVLLSLSWRVRPGAKVPITRASLSRVDYLGCLLLMAGSILLVFAIQEAGAMEFAWNSPTIVAALVVAGGCWVGLGAWEYRLTYYAETGEGVVPLFPLRVLGRRPMAAAVATTTLSGFSYLMLIILLPQRFQIVNLNTPLTAGAHLLPLLAGAALGSFTTGIVNKTRNRTFYTLLPASCLVLLGCGLLSTVGDGFRVQARMYGFQVVMGVGFGLTMGSVTIMTALETSNEERAVAQGVIAQVRILGGSLGVAVSTIIFNAAIARHLPSILSPTQLSQLRKTPAVIVTFDALQKLAVRRVFAESFRENMRVCAWVGCVALAVTLLVWQGRPPQPVDVRRAAEEGRLREREAARGREEAGEV